MTPLEFDHIGFGGGYIPPYEISAGDILTSLALLVAFAAAPVVLAVIATYLTHRHDR